MAPTRRDFVTLASATAFGIGLHRSPVGFAGPDVSPPPGDPAFRELAAAALGAARAAGASYADVRFTRTRQEEISISATGLNNTTVQPPRDEAAVGVRTLVDGAWGYAAGAVWAVDAMARLARESAAQAKINAVGRRRKIDMGPTPPAVTGTWTQAVDIDPFTVPLAEKFDVLWGHWETAFRNFSSAIALTNMAIRLRRREKTFASTDGSFIAQTTYYSHPYLTLRTGYTPWAFRTLDRFQPSGRGWEAMTDGTIARDIPPAIEEAILMTAAEPVSPGRYDIVFDALTVARLIGQTIGKATELDRVLGYEANAGGTSYLLPPDAAAGRYDYGNPLLNVTANRTLSDGLATVQWDDDGVAPEPYAVVQDGRVVDYHTNRELAPALAPWYGAGRPPRSHGCAGGSTASAMPLLQPPNLEMTPGKTDASFEALVAGLEHGLVIAGGASAPASLDYLQYASPVTVDRQQLNGEITANFAYEVRQGKRVRTISNVECLFRTPELWKSLQAIGGPSSRGTAGCLMVKGQPRQELAFSVTAVPARFKQVAVTDRMRKA